MRLASPTSKRVSGTDDPNPTTVRNPRVGSCKSRVCVRDSRGDQLLALGRDTYRTHGYRVPADESLKLNCSYRLLAAGELSSAVAELNGQVVEGRITTSYPGDADSTAILILIDTSDPARQPVIEKNISHIDALLDAAAPHHRFALATFDTDLYLLAPVGSSNEEVREGARGVRAKSKDH